MSTSDKLKEQKEDPDQTFGSSWVWGFFFGWITLIVAFFCVIIRPKEMIPLCLFLALLVFLIITNLVKVTGRMGNSKYGKTALFTMVIASLQFLYLIIMNKVVYNKWF
jgi:hypothetical protein